MLTIELDRTQPNRYHLWSDNDECYLLRSVTEGRIREHLRVTAIEAADAALDRAFDNRVVEARELH